MLQDVHVAEDIVQECFIKFWEKSTSIQIQVSYEAYLSKMVRNRCLDFLRSTKRDLILNVENVEGIPIEDNQELELSDLSSSVNTAIDKLPERCRQIFVLSRFEKLTYKEIAEELNLSTKTVEHQISKALKQMRISLKGFLCMVF